MDILCALPARCPLNVAKEWRFDVQGKEQPGARIYFSPPSDEKNRRFVSWELLRRNGAIVSRVGIYAGTFDPIHAGHLAFARQAMTACNLEKVFFLVEPRPRRKQGVKALEHRTAMVQLAIADQPRMGVIMLEQSRFNVTETMPKLRKRFEGAELYLLMGDDVVNHLAHWPHVDELLNSVNFVVGIRNEKEQKVRATLATLKRTRGMHLNYELFESTFPKYSSASIRLSIKRGKEPNGLLPVVQDYIAEHNLYSSTISRA
ncbi:MAG: Cytidyltransferase-related protein [Candidatus Saccharibacteria bacterium]|nr:Cytidyltransferase-related protein [Candidatus Saccharibacteria bacterium]